MYFYIAFDALVVTLKTLLRHTRTSDLLLGVQLRHVCARTASLGYFLLLFYFHFGSRPFQSLL